MRRRRERDQEDLLKFSAAWLFLMGVWVWSRFTPAVEVGPYTGPGDLVGWVVMSFLVALQPVVDQFMPSLLLGGVVLGGIWFLVGRREVREMRRDQNVLTLRQLAPDRFEDWCAARLRDLGYDVRVVGKQGDHGIDLVARRDGETAAVQCRRFAQTTAVTEPQLRDLYGAMHALGASHTIMITTGHYTSAARSWATGKPIQLWGPEDLMAAELRPEPAPAPAAAVDLGRCPSCRSALVGRTNRRTGEGFVGCTGYPRCRFTRRH